MNENDNPRKDPSLSRSRLFRAVAGLGVLIGVFAAAGYTVLVLSSPEEREISPGSVLSNQAERNPQNPYLEGTTRLFEGEYEEAAHHFSQVMDASPGHSFARLGRAQANYYAGRHSAALQDLDWLIEEGFLPFTTYSLRANTYVRMGRYEEAISDSSQALRFEPEMPTIAGESFPSFVRGYAREMTGAPFKAVRDYERALEINPENARAQKQMEGLRWATVEREELDTAAKKARHAFDEGRYYEGRSEFEKALEIFNKALEYDSENELYLSHRAYALRELKRYDEALDAYTHLVFKRPGDPAVYSNRGYVYSLMGNATKAIEDYNQALEYDPDHVNILVDRAFAYADLDPERERAEFDRLVEQYPDSSRVWSARGIFHDRQGEHEKAIADYSRAMELEPDNPSHLLNRRHAYMKTGQYEEALNDTSILLEDPGYTVSRLTERAAILALLERYDEAVADVSRAFQYQGPHEDIYYVQGLIHARQGEFDEARESFTRAIAQVGLDAPRLLMSRAKACLKLERPETALEDLDRAIQRDPETAELYALRAMAHESLDQPGKAAEDREKARELDPEVNLEVIEFTAGYDD